MKCKYLIRKNIIIFKNWTWDVSEKTVKINKTPTRIIAQNLYQQWKRNLIHII